MPVVSRLAVRVLIFVCLLVAGQTAHAGEKIAIAAAADLKFALDEIVVLFKKAHPADQIETIYGSSGKFHTQIQQGAPYDLYFSADIAYPRALKAEGLSSSEVQTYGVGRIVLWSPPRDAGNMTLNDLAGPTFQKIAIANPLHAPYGKRAEEALKAAGVWEKMQSKLVYGENVAQAAQFVQSGNAQVGIIALSLALSPELAKHGSYALISDKLHQSLEQGFIVTRRAADNALAREFARFMSSKEARAIMTRYGFVLPGEAK
ncbi:MAG: molybdate ABC transporter substrate-binding protein [Betaproteobacteria bacterium]|nr:molybdate ABC transporter substrate-binding protein [Betaproteobacteria bacterium]MDE2310251.1 molybdate ABC transporter substrate-binding protein [Betaproteobacteria bacterium]